ncbi:hypothetical protein OUZ56_009416 [Daphnia magna]|uniref:Uncharacterized protein n=1 Tax=Daphnia magna TaxID=35525 RepID=A0ABR0AG66_9CRUS|nr:hypothetical protein OUZ56_009416 [Daphnia magna]
MSEEYQYDSDVARNISPERSPQERRVIINTFIMKGKAELQAKSRRSHSMKYEESLPYIILQYVLIRFHTESKRHQAFSSPTSPSPTTSVSRSSSRSSSIFTSSRSSSRSSSTI